MVWLSFTPIYEATAWMEIKEQPLYVAFEPRSNSNASLFFKTQLQTIHSPVVLARVAALPEIARVPEVRAEESILSWLERGLKASFRGESELCDISFRARRPEVAATVANAIMDAYLVLQRDHYGQQTERIVELLTEEKRRRADELEQLQERVRVLTKKSGRGDATAIGQKEVVLVQNPIAALEARRTAVEVERIVVEAKLKAYHTEATAHVGVPADVLEQALETDPEVIELKNQLIQAKSRLRDRKRVSKSENNMSMQKLATTVKSIEESLTKLRDELRPKVSERLMLSMNAQRAESIATLQDDVAHKQHLERAWQERIDAQRNSLGTSDEQSLELEFARGELQRSEEVFQRIADRIVALRTEMRAPLRTSVLKRAARPEKPLEAAPYKILAIAFLGPLAVPFGLAFLWERRLGRISIAQQISTAVNVPLLGEITALPRRTLTPKLDPSDRLARDRATFEESINALRVGLTQRTTWRDLRTVAVTSAVSREGKTSLSYSLALSLANSSDGAVLLIDSDMRAPDLHSICKVAQYPGLAEVLSGYCSLDDAITAHETERVHFLPAGRLEVNPHSLLKNDAFSSLLSHVRPRYQYIIIDAPPVLAASEALVIAASADGTLVCTMRDISRGHQLRMTCQKLTDAGAALLGVVFNGIPARTWVYKYGGYAYAHKHDSRMHDGHDT